MASCDPGVHFSHLGKCPNFMIFEQKTGKSDIESRLDFIVITKNINIITIQCFRYSNARIDTLVLILQMDQIQDFKVIN